MGYYSFNIFSNMIYILPILCILYEKFISNKNKKNKSYYSNPECVILIIGFILINCISTIYHNCERIQENKQEEKPWNNRNYLRDSYLCYDAFDLTSLENLDHIIVFTFICIILVIITPIYGEYKILMIYLIFIIILILSFLNKKALRKKYKFEVNYFIYSLIGFFALIFYGDFLYNIKKFSYTSIFLCFMATLFFIGAIICFIIPDKLYDIKKSKIMKKKYYPKHSREYNYLVIDPEIKNKKLLLLSLWHLFSGISGSLFLLIRIKNIDI